MGFYLLIAVVLLMTIFALRGGMGNQEKVTYAQVRQLLEQQPFDVLAIDESLMSSSGVDFCMAIRGRYPGMTRIVMTSSPTQVRDRVTTTAIAQLNRASSRFTCTPRLTASTG